MAGRALLLTQLSLLGTAVPVALPRITPLTDDPPQPRGADPRKVWAPGLLPPPAAVDPRLLGSLPQMVPPNTVNQSADDGLPTGQTPRIFVFGDTEYTMGVAVAPDATVFTAAYSAHLLHAFNANCSALPERHDVPPKSEFYGYGGTYAVLAHTDGSLFVSYDGNGCMKNNPASVGAACAFVRQIHLGPTGAEKIVVQNLTSPKQMALDTQGRLYVVEEWEERIVRWDPRTGTTLIVLQNSEYAASGPIEGIAISTSGDLFFSEYGVFGNEVDDPRGNGRVAGVPLKSGAVWVKRQASGTVELVARGFWRTRGLALDETRGVLFVANEANAWDQGSSGALSRIDLRHGNTVTKVAVGLDYPQFPALQHTTGRIFVPLALHDKLVAYDPRPQAAFAPIVSSSLTARNISAAVSGGSWAPVTTGAGEGKRAHAATPTLSLTVQEMDAPQQLTGSAALDDGTSPGVSVWVRIPAELIKLYKLELPYNDAYHPGPDNFMLPSVSCSLTRADGSHGMCKTSVQVNHKHHGPRWPMLIYNGTVGNEGAEIYRGRMFPQATWDASPESYLIFVHAHWFEN